MPGAEITARSDETFFRRNGKFSETVIIIHFLFIFCKIKGFNLEKTIMHFSLRHDAGAGSQVTQKLRIPGDKRVKA